MNSTSGRKACSRIAGALAALLLLQGCISNSTFLRDGATPEPQQFDADSADCVDFTPLFVGLMAGAAMGALQGAVIGASTDAGPAAAFGAGVGAVFGLAAGMIAAGGGEAYDRCMEDKGYQRAG